MPDDNQIGGRPAMDGFAQPPRPPEGLRDHEQWPAVRPAHQPQPEIHRESPARPKPPIPDTPVLEPMPVVKMWSTRGMEYAMMSVSLWVSAITIAWILLNVVNGSRTFDFLVVPTSALVVGLPIFAFFFLRLKKAEMNNPILKADASRRRWTQLTQFLAFIAVLVNLIVLVYEVLARYGTSKDHLPSIAKVSLDSLVVLVIAGGLLAYYWLDEHRPIER